MQEAAPIPIPSTSLIETRAPAALTGDGSVAVISRRSWFRRGAFPLLIVLFVFAVFMEALTAGYVYWDDDDLLLLNTAYRSLSWERLEWMFTTSYTGHFQPLTWLSYWLDFTLWRGDVFGFHLTNVVLHAFTAVTVYCVAGRLLRLVCKDRADSVISINSAAALTAVLFACHPLRVESVAWIAERRDVLGGFFFMVSVALYLRYVDSTSRGRRNSSNREDGLPLAPGAGDALVEPNPRRSKVYYLAALAACLLSLLSKATAMTLPVVLLILDVYPLGRLGRHAEFVRVSSRRVWLEKVPFFALAALGAARALVAQAEVGALKSVGDYDWISRFVQACYGLAFYAWKTVWPVSLGPLYQIPSREVLLGDKLWFLVFGVCGVIAAAIALRRRWPGLLAVLAVYVVVLSPVLGFAQSGPQLVADRYSYLSCIGFAILGGYGLLCFARVGWFKRSRYARAAAGLLVAAPVGLLAHLTYAQAHIWSGPITLWREGVRISPTSSVAHVNYADALFQAGDLDSAYDHYGIALELDPHDIVGLHHRGDLYVALGLPHLAIRDYIRALRIDPARRRAPLSLARLLVAGGHAREAAIVLCDSARRNPDSFVLMRFLAELLATHPDKRMRDGEEAVRWAIRVVLAEGQSHIPSLVTLATALAEAGRFPEAVATAEAALSFAQREDDRLFVDSLRHRLELFRQQKPFRTSSTVWPFEPDDGSHDAHSN